MRFILLALLLSLGVPSVLSAHGPEAHEEEAEASEATIAPTSEAELPESSSESVAEETDDDAGFIDVLRALHPATVHFPIAFFLLAGLVEVIALARRRDELFRTVDVLIVAGAAGAVLAALFGWIHTGLWLGGDTAMQWHRWSGTGVALAGLVMLLLVRRGNRGVLRPLLLLICVSLLVQGYWGGELAHGPNHLTELH